MAQSDRTKPERHEFKSPFGLHVTTYVGDIIDALADAIVTAEDKTMTNLSYITKALIKMDALFEIDREILRKRHKTFPLWTVCSSKVKEQIVFHAYLKACNSNEPKEWTINMKKLYTTLYQEADRQGVLVLALPLLGAGSANLTTALQVAVSSVAAHKPKSISDVLFVSMDEYIVQQIAAQCKFEFSGRPQSDKGKRTVSFKLDGHDADEEEEDNSRPRRRQKKSKPRGPPRGPPRGGGTGRGTRKISKSSILSSDSDELMRQDRELRNLERSSVTNHAAAAARTEKLPGHSSKMEVDERDYIGLVDVSSDDSFTKPRTSRNSYTNKTNFRYSSPLSDNNSRATTSDDDIIRPSMKGSRVSVNGKTYDLNMRYEGSPMLRSAEDVREKVIGPYKQIQQSAESPRMTPRSLTPLKCSPVPSPSQIPLAKTRGAPATKPPPQLEVKPVQRNVLPKIEPPKVDDDPLDSPRRTKSSELGRTRKRSQSLAAKVEQEAMELLRAEHDRDAARQLPPPIGMNSDPPIEPPEWSASKGQAFSPQSNALSSQNRSSWSSDTDSDITSRATDSLDCAICLRVPNEPKRLDKCGHMFCTECIDNSFAEYKPVCPSCNTVYAVITGNQSQGSMDVTLTDDRLPGYSRYDTIVITYHFPDGIQGPEHPDEGHSYKGTTRKAYLPNSKKGMDILRLLRTAFKRKLLFTIVRSATSGQENVVTWSDIHHKTSMKGGITRFGYPDEKYLTRVKEELARKGVTD